MWIKSDPRESCVNREKDKVLSLMLDWNGGLDLALYWPMEDLQSRFSNLNISMFCFGYMYELGPGILNQNIILCKQTLLLQCVDGWFTQP